MMRMACGLLPILVCYILMQLFISKKYLQIKMACPGICCMLLPDYLPENYLLQPGTEFPSWIRTGNHSAIIILRMACVPTNAIHARLPFLQTAICILAVSMDLSGNIFHSKSTGNNFQLFLLPKILL